MTLGNFQQNRSSGSNLLINKALSYGTVLFQYSSVVHYHCMNVSALHAGGSEAVMRCETHGQSSSCMAGYPVRVAASTITS